MLKLEVGRTSVSVDKYLRTDDTDCILSLAKNSFLTWFNDLLTQNQYQL